MAVRSPSARSEALTGVSGYARRNADASSALLLGAPLGRVARMRRRCEGRRSRRPGRGRVELERAVVVVAGEHRGGRLHRLPQLPRSAGRPLRRCLGLLAGGPDRALHGPGGWAVLPRLRRERLQPGDPGVSRFPPSLAEAVSRTMGRLPADLSGDASLDVCAGLLSPGRALRVSGSPPPPWRCAHSGVEKSRSRSGKSVSRPGCGPLAVGRMPRA